MVMERPLDPFTWFVLSSERRSPRIAVQESAISVFVSEYHSTRIADFDPHWL